MTAPWALSERSLEFSWEKSGSGDSTLLLFCLAAAPAVLSHPEPQQDVEMPEPDPWDSWFVYSAFSRGFIVGGTLLCVCPVTALVTQQQWELAPG